MATIKETIERDGETINIYESGAEYSVTRGRLVKAPPSAMITKETAPIMKQKRQEKVSRLLREKIRAATESMSDLPIRDSAEAIAEAGGILWTEIVLDRDAYHRDRLEAFTKLGQLAGGIASNDKRSDPEKQEVALAVLDAGAALVRALADALRPPAPREIIEAEATDTRNE